MTHNIPNIGSIKLALLFIDNVGNNDAGVLIKPLKIQDLSTNQALFSVELDGNMNGINPLSGQSTSISRINGLAVYNDGDQPIQFNSGNMAALTATFTNKYILKRIFFLIVDCIAKAKIKIIFNACNKFVMLRINLLFYFNVYYLL